MKNTVIVGYGGVGKIHARAVKELSFVNLYGVCDIDKPKCDDFRKKYGGKNFSSLDGVLQDEQVTSVHICTPHYLHYEMARKALNAGKEVVLEKPAVMKREELEKLTAELKDPKLLVMMQNRLNSCIVKMRDIIKEENLGKLLCAKGILTWHRDENYYNQSKWRGSVLYEGGGVLINQAIHTIDLLIYLVGDIKSVCATTQNHKLKGCIETEDTVESVLEFQNGARGIFYGSNSYGTDSGVILELVFQKETFLYTNGILLRNNEVIAKDEKGKMGKDCWGAGHIKVLREFYQGINNFKLITVENTMKTVFGIYESAKENGKEIFI